MPNTKSPISDEYRTVQAAMHRDDTHYGNASVRMAPTVMSVLNEIRPPNLLDYGAGKGRLGQELAKKYPHKIDIRNYDPAIPEWSVPPTPSDFVCCLDVLEHIEPNYLEDVLNDLKRVTLRHGFFSIYTGPAKRILPDGRNAHLIQKPPKWWLPKLMEMFELLNFFRLSDGFWIIVQSEAETERAKAISN